MTVKKFAIVFETKIQDETAGRFSIPTEVCNFFNLKPKDKIHLIIENKHNTQYFYKDELKSGYEIYDEKTLNLFPAGQEIRVTVFHPDYEYPLELKPYK